MEMLRALAPVPTRNACTASVGPLRPLGGCKEGASQLGLFQLGWHVAFNRTGAGEGSRSKLGHPRYNWGARAPIAPPTGLRNWRKQ
jgi:hypothetical protein